jgi:hypothetical protein
VGLPKESLQPKQYSTKVPIETRVGSTQSRQYVNTRALSQLNQGSMSIQEFYSFFANLWVEYTNIVYASVPLEGLIAIQSVHETSKCDQFLMKLRGDFKAIRSNLMNRELVPLLDICGRAS